MRLLLGLAVAAAPLLAQQVCQPTPVYSPCDILFDLNDQEAAAHTNPYLTVDIRAELRSPKARTILMRAFHDGGRKMIIRFAAIDPGNWDFRITSNIERFNGKLGQVSVTDSPDQGFLLPANVHHWMFSESRKAHLWVGDTFLDFATAPAAMFNAYSEARGKQKLTHVRGLLLGPGQEKNAFSGPDQPNAAFFQQLDQRILALNKAGMFVDLILAHDGKQFMDLLPNWPQRDRFINYVVSRYAAMHITWNMFQEFESYADSRPLMKDLGQLILKYDPYKHPRSTGTTGSTGALVGDGWMNYINHHSSDDALGAIEHHVFPATFVNTGFGDEKSMDPDTFRKRLWNAAMNGEYLTASLNPERLDSPSAKAMTAFYDFFARTRYWELEPYYDVDNARCLALPGTEYVLYVEKPDQVEILVEKHGYDVFWFNPITGELTKEKKEFKGEKFVGEPPSKNQDWVLHLSREGRKEGMLRSYKFESRNIDMQEIEQLPTKMPFDLLEPIIDPLSVSKPPKFAVKLKRETRGTRQMRYLWTGEVPTEGRGYRVLGTGAQGTLNIPGNIAQIYPAVFNMRIYAINAVGKVYSLDKVFRLTK